MWGAIAVASEKRYIQANVFRNSKDEAMAKHMAELLCQGSVEAAGKKTKCKAIASFNTCGYISIKISKDGRTGRHCAGGRRTCRGGA
jgi:hypothetical protein